MRQSIVSGQSPESKWLQVLSSNWAAVCLSVLSFQATGAMCGILFEKDTRNLFHMCEIVPSSSEKTRGWFDEE